MSREEARRQVARARAAAEREGKPLLRKLRTPVRVRHPYALEVELFKLLRLEVRALYVEIGERVLPAYDEMLTSVHAYRPQAARADRVGETLDRTFGPLLARWGAKAKLLKPKIDALVRRVSEANYLQFMRQVRSVTGVDIIVAEPWLADELAVASREAAALVVDIGEQAIARVDRIVSDGVRAGDSTKAIKTQLAEELGITERRAALIAVDQIGKLNGNLDRLRQENIGVERYTWRTCGDRRVRQAHRAREGREFSWDNPPADGHPGHPVRCRCTAEPVLDMFADLLALNRRPVDWEAIGQPIRRSR